MKLKSILGAAILLALLLLPLQAISQDRLLIIAPDEFIDELVPLKHFKDASARPTTLLSLSQVYVTYGGSDEPEQIKYCIADYEDKEGIEFVLIVGDCDKFPVRSCKGHNTEWGSMYLPSDLYYADLYKSDGSFDDWDGGNFPYGGNKIYGEMDFNGFDPCDLNKLNLDLINMYPDVSVARVPASNETEVTTYVNKVINYELKAPGNWFNKALWVVDCDACTPAKKDRLDSYLTNNGFSPIIKRYYDDWDLVSYDDRAAEINNVINDGVGFVNHCGHGGRFSWQRWYDSSKISALTNKDKLPIVYSVSCGSARFFWDGCGCAGCVPRDFYQDVNGNEWVWENCSVKTTLRPEPMFVQPSTYDEESFAEEFLVKRDTGGIAYIGTTFKMEYGGDDLDMYFFEAYDALSKPLYFGYMWNYALSKFITFQDLCDYYAYIHIHKVTPFGDPSLIVGGAFTTTLSGDVYDGSGGPLVSYSRYRITGDVTVPLGQTLNANLSASILFEDGKKITAMDPNGFIVNGTSNEPVYFLSFAADPQAEHVVHGMKVRGQLRLQNGGEIKLF